MLKMLSPEPSASRNRNIKDHWSQITITNMITIVKKFEISRELPKCDKQPQSEQVLLEQWYQYTCFIQGCHKPPVCLKIFKKPKDKKQYLWSTIKWSTMKRGLPVFVFSRNLSCFIQRVELIGIKLFIKFPSYSFNICRICKWFQLFRY